MLEAIALLDAVLGVPTKTQTEKLRDSYRAAGLRAMGLEPFVMGGIETRGCSQCGGTMYRTVEPGGGGSQWVCASSSCGAVE